MNELLKIVCIAFAASVFSGCGPSFKCDPDKPACSGLARDVGGADAGVGGQADSPGGTAGESGTVPSVGGGNTSVSAGGSSAAGTSAGSSSGGQAGAPAIGGSSSGGNAPVSTGGHASAGAPATGGSSAGNQGTAGMAGTAGAPTDTGCLTTGIRVQYTSPGATVTGANGSTDNGKTYTLNLCTAVDDLNPSATVFSCCFSTELFPSNTSTYVLMQFKLSGGTSSCGGNNCDPLTEYHVWVNGIEVSQSLFDVVNVSQDSVNSVVRAYVNGAEYQP